MKIYLDNCVLNRPFDDQTQERIYLETQAFLILLKKIEDEEIEMTNSDAIQYEIERLTEWERKEKVISYLNLATEYIVLNENIEERALEFEKLGIMGMDALHIAVAEVSNVDYFITCDDILLKRYKRNEDKINLKIVTLLDIIGIIYYDKNN